MRVFAGRDRVSGCSEPFGVSTAEPRTCTGVSDIPVRVDQGCLGSDCAELVTVDGPGSEAACGAITACQKAMRIFLRAFARLDGQDRVRAQHALQQALDALTGPKGRDPNAL